MNITNKNQEIKVEGIKESEAKNFKQQLEAYYISKTNFEALEQPNPFLHFKLSKAETECLVSGGAGSPLVEMNSIFYKNTSGDWKKDINNPEIVKLVAADTTLQNATLNTLSELSKIIVSERNSSRKSQESLLRKTEGSLYKPNGVTSDHYLVTDESVLLAASQLAKASVLQETDTILARFQARNKDTLTSVNEKQVPHVDVPEVKVNILNVSPSTPIDFVADDTKYKIVKTISAADREREAKVRGIPSDLDEMIPSASVMVTPPVSSPNEQVYPLPSQKNIRSTLSVEEMIGRLTASVEKGGERVEQAENKLLERNKVAGEKLKRFGLRGLTGTLEGFGKLKPRTRLGMGVIFAGASVFTGGGVGAAAFLVSSLSFASDIYKKNLLRLEKEGDILGEETKHKAALRGAIFGTILAAGSFFAFQEMFKLANEVWHVIGDKASVFVDGAKEYFGNSSIPTPPGDVSATTVTEQHVSITKDVPASTVVTNTPSPMVGTGATISPESITEVSSAQAPSVGSGNLTEIMENQRDAVAAMVRKAAGM